MTSKSGDDGFDMDGKEVTTWHCVHIFLRDDDADGHVFPPTPPPFPCLHTRIIDEEVNFVHTARTAEDEQFDNVVSVLEEIILNSKFADMQNDYCEQHCDTFEETKENKLEYTEIFNDYTRMVEDIIGRALAEKIPGFRMADLEAMLARRPDELAGEVFETLTSLGDFTEFKDLMIATKSMKARGGMGGAMGGGFDLSVSGSGVSGGDMAVGGMGMQGLSVSGTGGGKSKGGGGGGLDLGISGKKL
jgi:ADP-ribosylation factor-like protein 2-binding protein